MTFVLDRRGLLRAGLGLALAPGLRGVALAAPSAPPAGLLVLVNLRGGMDGLHALSPADDAHFVDKRPPGLRTLAEGERAGHRLDASAAVDFRLHPAAEGLAGIWREGRMALWPAAGLPATTRSHFEAQALMGLGLGHRARTPVAQTGWLSEWAARVAGPEVPVAAIAGQRSLPDVMAGGRQALAVGNLAGGLAPPQGAFGAAMLAALHEGSGIAAAAGRSALAGLASLDHLLPRQANGQVAPYQPAAGADYRPAGPFGQALRSVAQLAKLQPRLVAATVDIGGWDMHEGQPGRMQDRMRVLSAGLAALDADLAALGRRWSVLVASEFGRRLRGNRSNGTDHGRAGLVFAFGGEGFGLGRQFGPWPGLAPDALEEGVDLRVTTDYRAAFRAVITDLLPGAPPPPFPAA